MRSRIHLNQLAEMLAPVHQLASAASRVSLLSTTSSASRGRGCILTLQASKPTRWAQSHRSFADIARVLPSCGVARDLAIRIALHGFYGRATDRLPLGIAYVF